MNDERPRCELCGHPMPPGEEMFKYHGYSGPCPAPPVNKGVLLTDLPALPEPPCAPGTRPHRERVAEVDRMMREGQTAAVMIDDEPAVRSWYLHEFRKYPRLEVIDQGAFMGGMYFLKVRKGPPTN